MYEATVERAIRFEGIGLHSGRSVCLFLGPATGGGRVPAQGFKALQRNDGKYCRFHIQSADASGSAASGVLPVSHTCFNRLDLPVYASKAKLLEALKVVCSLDVTGFSID